MPSGTTDETPPPHSFKTQLSEELEAIEKGRRAGDPNPASDQSTEGTGADKAAVDQAQDMSLFGVAFSGGGIRSATFNLGVIQCLARLRLLHRVDYLSTVSGGGYIGGWLSAWVHRSSKNAGSSGICSVERELEQLNRGSEEADEIRWLRRFSNYLTPHVGPFSVDTLTGVATFLRNLLLNQIILVMIGSALLVAPWLFVALLQRPDHFEFWVAPVTFALMLYGSLWAGYETHRAGTRGADNGKEKTFWTNVGASLSEQASALHKKAPQLFNPAKRHHRRYWALLGCFAVAALLAGPILTSPRGDVTSLPLMFAVPYFFGTLAGWFFAHAFKGDETTAIAAAKERLKSVRAQRSNHMMTAPPTGETDREHEGVTRRSDRTDIFWAWAGLIWAWLAPVVWTLVAATLLAGQLYLWVALTSVETAQPASFLFAVIFGPPAVIAAILLTLTVHLGLSSRGLRESARELWSRHGAHQLRFSLGWLLLTGLALLGPLVLMLVDDWVVAMGGMSWALTTVAGVVAGSGTTTGGQGSNKIAEFTARIAPYVFVLGLLLALSYGLYRAMWWQWNTDHPAQPSEAVCEEIVDPLGQPVYGLDREFQDGDAEELIYETATQTECLPGYRQLSVSLVRDRADPLALGVLGLLGIALLLSYRVDINVFAFHMFYRNRIERCYMGASNRKRQAHPYTGLDPEDSPKLGELTLADSDSHLGQRPFPIINTALNITSSKNHAWQERKAASFTFTPMFCGYEFQESDGATIRAYQPTEDFVKGWGWLSLGLPVTISGAAASPNAGYHTNPATAFLMTVFNVRLGWWMQNPHKHRAWKTPGPKLALIPLLKELIGRTSYESNYVYLSDGGHFENLGIYELVRRRCRYIVACDAGCDPDFEFEDLGNAIRKCKIDLGIDIDIDPRAIRPENGERQSKFPCAVGRIAYPDDEPPGYLLYVKASLTGDEPADVLQYAAEKPAFPHQTTADQWFNESQFESYRTLGFHLMDKVFRDSLQDDLEDTFNALRERWYRPSPQVKESFAKYGRALEEIFEFIRKEDDLKFMDEQIYPEWPYLMKTGKPAPTPTMLPSKPKEIRAGFYLCNSLIQIMENVYHDLNLDEQQGHPDNRGWMNLFRHWSWAGMLRVTWAISASTYGARFQRFCRQRLGLPVGEVVCIPSEELRGAKVEPNFLEIEICKCIQGHLDDKGLGAGIEVRQLLLGARSPFEEARALKFWFPFALALIDTRSEKPQLLYYRVRDHLRGIGLGRKGLAVLRETAGVCYRPDDTETAARLDCVREAFEKKNLTAEADTETLKHLWDSVTKAARERGKKELDKFV